MSKKRNLRSTEFKTIEQVRKFGYNSLKRYQKSLIKKIGILNNLQYCNCCDVYEPNEDDLKMIKELKTYLSNIINVVLRENEKNGKAINKRPVSHTNLRKRRV